MNNGYLIAGGIGLGAGLMYLFDPERGGRRRARVRDKAVSAVNKGADAASATARDLGWRTYGTISSLRAANRSAAADDDKIIARVRSKLGRVVSHPRAVGVVAHDGTVTLSGPVLEAEADALVEAARSVAGVEAVEDRLERHKTAGAVAALQGGRPRAGARLDILQANWSPATRALAAVAGGSLALLGASRRSAVGAVIATAGLGLAARAATNTAVKRLVGLTSARNAVSVRKTINIDAPLEKVYGFWRNFENLPQWMTNVAEVRINRDGGSHWVVKGPAGVPVEWDAVITRDEPNRLLAWKSVKVSTTKRSGIVRFEEAGRGTRVDVLLQYTPPGGAIGHGVATLLGSDPKAKMDEDLLRLKTLIETGAVPHDAAQAERP